MMIFKFHLLVKTEGAVANLLAIHRSWLERTRPWLCPARVSPDRCLAGLSRRSPARWDGGGRPVGSELPSEMKSEFQFLGTLNGIQNIP